MYKEQDSIHLQNTQFACMHTHSTSQSTTLYQSTEIKASIFALQ